MREIRGAVAVVTGAASGIGRALAVDLAKRGAQIALADVKQPGWKKPQAAGRSTARTYSVDVSKAAAMEDFARKVQQDFGRTSLLVNNAGVALMGTFAEVSLEDMQWLIGINFWGVAHGCKFFLPLLQREPDAHIVNLSSIFGLIGPPGQTAYAASKFAVRGFSESLREELREPGDESNIGSSGGNCHAHCSSRASPDAARPRLPARKPRILQEGCRDSPGRSIERDHQGDSGNKNRVLIGTDAYRIDRIQRLFPARASAMFAVRLENAGTRKIQSGGKCSQKPVKYAACGRSENELEQGIQFPCRKQSASE